MAIRFCANLIVVCMILTFASSAVSDNDAATDDLSMTLNFEGVDPPGCRDDLLRDTSSAECDTCGSDSDICEVQGTSTECNGRGFGHCDCKQTMYFDMASVYHPPSFASDGDPRCYAMSLKASCTFRDGDGLEAQAVGDFCVLPGGNFMKSTGVVRTLKRNGGNSPSNVVEITGKVDTQNKVHPVVTAGWDILKQAPFAGVK